MKLQIAAPKHRWIILDPSGHTIALPFGKAWGVPYFMTKKEAQLCIKHYTALRGCKPYKVKRFEPYEEG